MPRVMELSLGIFAFRGFLLQLNLDYMDEPVTEIFVYWSTREG